MYHPISPFPPSKSETDPKNPLKPTNGEDDTHADADAMTAEFGDEENPKTLSVAISAIQESILNHERFEDYTAEQLGALKMYMNGATGGVCI